VILEKVHSMPKQGVKSVFSFGQNFGMCRLWATLWGGSVIYVTPHKWMTSVFDSDKGGGTTKDRSLLFARRRWQNVDLRLRKHHDHGRSDALCIAEWGRRNHR